MVGVHDFVRLDDIDDGLEEGARVLLSAERVLSNLDKEDAGKITLAYTVDMKRIFARVKYNGNGIIPPDAAGDIALREAIEKIQGTIGGEEDRSGQ